MSDDLELTDDHVVLKLDETNELFFKIIIEGTNRAPDVIRLTCETDGITYSFRGQPTEEANVICFVVPPLKSEAIQPGVQYNTQVEVLVENKYFVPVRFKAKFSEPVRVVAESVRRAVSEPAKSAKLSEATTPITPVPVQSKPTIEVKAQSVKKPSLRDKYESSRLR